MIATQAEYRAYLRSNAWQVKRWNKIYRDADWVVKDLGVLKAECCGASIHVEDVEIHHKHYRSIGQEAYSDLMIACVGCHERLDEERNSDG